MYVHPLQVQQFRHAKLDVIKVGNAPAVVEEMLSPTNDDHGLLSECFA